MWFHKNCEGFHKSGVLMVWIHCSGFFPQCNTHPAVLNCAKNNLIVYLHVNSMLVFSKSLNRQLAGEQSKADFHVILIRASEMANENRTTHCCCFKLSVCAHTSFTPRISSFQYLLDMNWCSFLLVLNILKWKLTSVYRLPSTPVVALVESVEFCLVS